MQFPLTMTFKILALAPQIFVRDANGNDLLYVKQKLFKLREAIHIFSDQSQSDQRYQIKADRIIDFSARYEITDYQGITLGAIKREGARSLWRASYKIFKGDSIVYQIREESVMNRVLDGLFGEIPVIGLLSGYIFNPAYLVKLPGDESETVLRFAKQPSLFESNFIIEKHHDVGEQDEELLLLSVLMCTLLERTRG
ncbi:MAG: hypothetical protein AAF485_26645 [Chloroflexota bacterium]